MCLLVLASLVLASCKNLPPPQPASDTPAAAMPQTLGGIPSHRY